MNNTSDLIKVEESTRSLLPPFSFCPSATGWRSNKAEDGLQQTLTTSTFQQLKNKCLLFTMELAQEPSKIQASLVFFSLTLFRYNCQIKMYLRVQHDVLIYFTLLNDYHNQCN
jgi:hypothetical protein